MHYKNGREASEGDPVVWKYRDGGPIVGTQVGIIHHLCPGSDGCNCTVAMIVPGGVNQALCSVGDLYHAADCFAALESRVLCPAPKKVEMAAPGNSWSPPQTAHKPTA